MRLVNKTVLLTGASKGFGKALAKFLWDEGASLLLVARSSIELELPKHHPSQTLDIMTCDITSITSEILANKTIDILINNAGIQGPIGSFETNDWEEWQRTIEVDLLAPVYLSKCVLPQMKARKKGKIINLSGGGATSCRPGFSAYAVAKTGLVRFTEILAKECEADHIDINAIAPGMMSTQMTQEVLAAGSHQAGFNEYEAAAKISGAEKEPHATMQKALALCVYLASDESDGVTGKLISAVWDPWENLHKRFAELTDGIYTLRRMTE